MFRSTRPPSILFLAALALTSLMLLMPASFGRAGPGNEVHPGLADKKLRTAFTARHNIPVGLVGISPRTSDCYAEASRPPSPSKNETAETNIFFDIDREVTVDTDLVKGSAGVQINW